MSITNELRKYADELETAASRKSEHWFSPAAMKLTAIADRIDAEHEMATSEFWAKINAVPATDENMAEHGWVRLPVDADGEYIHVGDEMEGIDKYDSLKKVMGKVITVSFESDGIADVAIQVWSSDGKSWHRAYLDPYASVYRHYHTPTVEDVLREFAAEFNRDDSELCDEEIIERFATKLRLAGDAE